MRLPMLSAAFAVAVLAILSLDRPTTGGEGAAQDPAAMQEGMKRWMDSCTPGENHKWLAPMIGKWKTKFTMWMAPDQPMTSEGTAEFSWVFEDKWVESKWSGVMMGMPYAGRSWMGYDNFKKKFVSTRIDNMATAIYPCEGFLTQDKKTLILYGPLDEPMTGEHDKTVKYVWRVLGPDKLLLEVHDLAIGEENTRVVEVAYERVK